METRRTAKPPTDMVFQRLQQTWRAVIGSRRPIEFDDNIVHWLKLENSYEDLPLCDVRFPIEREFGIEIPTGDWDEFWGAGLSAGEWHARVEPTLTFGRLAEFVSQRLVATSFDAIEIAGRECASAGSFRGLEILATGLGGGLNAFGPSTPIRDKLRGEALWRFWVQLRLWTGDFVPPLVTLAQRWFIRWAFASAFLACCYCIGPLALPWWVALIIGPTFVFMALWLESLPYGSLPKGIKTFRDLAMLIAAREVPASAPLSFDQSSDSQRGK